MMDIDDLKAVCRDHGLEVSGARVQGDVLQLVPASLEALPPAEALRAIAGAMAPLGYRFVTLALGAADAAGAADDRPAGGGA